MSESVTCGTCVFRERIPGNAHIACVAPIESGKAPVLKRWHGCGVWPMNFDENIVESCPYASENPEDRAKARKRTPMEELASLLMR